MSNFKASSGRRDDFYHEKERGQFFPGAKKPIKIVDLVLIHINSSNLIFFTNMYLSGLERREEMRTESTSLLQRDSIVNLPSGLIIRRCDRIIDFSSRLSRLQLAISLDLTSFPSTNFFL